MSDTVRYPDFAEWGRQGGKARAKKLTAKRRKEIAKIAVRARERARKRAASGAE